jgi:hypothetical protein
VTITFGYTTVALLKARIANISGTSSDSMLEAVVEAVSREIDNYCGRRFYSVNEARYYSPDDENIVMVDDIGTSGGITVESDADGDRTYENTWADTDYDLWPYNDAPYMEIHTAPNGTLTFPTDLAKGVKVTAHFGYVYGTSSTDAPKVVQEACLIQCLRLWKRKDAPFGVAGSAEMGQMIVLPKLDPDVELLLKSLRRLV